MPFFKKKNKTNTPDLPTLPNFEKKLQDELNKPYCNIVEAITYIERGAPFYLTNQHGQTLLHIAVIQEQYEFIPLLEKFTLNMTDEDNYHKTPQDYYASNSLKR